MLTLIHLLHVIWPIWGSKTDILPASLRLGQFRYERQGRPYLTTSDLEWVLGPKELFLSC